MLKGKAKPCAGLSEKVLNGMYSDGYSPKSVDHHVRPIYSRLSRYCEEYFDESSHMEKLLEIFE